jgi:hypothetical protein
MFISAFDLPPINRSKRTLELPLLSRNGRSKLSQLTIQTRVHEKSSKLIYYGTPLLSLTHFEEDIERFIPINSCIYTLQFAVRD